MAATFNERGAPTSKKYLAELGLMMRNSSKAFQSFWLHFSFLALEKQPKNLRFHLTDTLVATFSETRPPTYRKYVVEQTILTLSWWKLFQTFWSHFFLFSLEEQPKNLNFQSIFASNQHFRGYFQWNACTYFHNICSWTRYNDAKSIKNILKFLVPLVHFCFR